MIYTTDEVAAHIRPGDLVRRYYLIESDIEDQDSYEDGIAYEWQGTMYIRDFFGDPLDLPGQEGCEVLGPTPSRDPLNVLGSLRDAVGRFVLRAGDTDYEFFVQVSMEEDGSLVENSVGIYHADWRNIVDMLKDSTVYARLMKKLAGEAEHFYQTEIRGKA